MGMCHRAPAGPESRRSRLLWHSLQTLTVWGRSECCLQISKSHFQQLSCPSALAVECDLRGNVEQGLPRGAPQLAAGGLTLDQPGAISVKLFTLFCTFYLVKRLGVEFALTGADGNRS